MYPKMKAKVKQIPHPLFTSARRLKPLEMNSIRCSKQHTILTPEQLDRLGGSKPEDNKN